jgi:hypothetical protein
MKLTSCCGQAHRYCSPKSRAFRIIADLRRLPRHHHRATHRRATCRRATYRRANRSADRSAADHRRESHHRSQRNPLPTRLLPRRRDSRPRATPAPVGLLDFQTYVAGCRSAPTPQKPGNVVITISVEATGGNGVYRYFHQGVEEPDKFIDVEWEKGSRLIGEVTVTSAGQSLTKEYDYLPDDYCP